MSKKFLQKSRKYPENMISKDKSDWIEIEDNHEAIIDPPLKKERPDLIIGLCGCMMQLNDIRNTIKKKHSHVDLIFGTNNINELPDMIYKHLRDNQFIESIKQNIKIVEDAKEVIQPGSSPSWSGGARPGG